MLVTQLPTVKVSKQKSVSNSANTAFTNDPLISGDIANALETAKIENYDSEGSPFIATSTNQSLRDARVVAII
jgi:hypothetical protein